MTQNKMLRTKSLNLGEARFTVCGSNMKQ